MNRLDKTLVVPKEIDAKLKNSKELYLVGNIREGWCGV
jgi:hypothetical protein